MRYLSRSHVVLVVLCLALPVLAQTVEPSKCILVFGAHADDVESLAGGTFARFIAEGYRGVYVVVTNNTAGCVIEKALDDSSIFTASDSPKTYPAGALETIQIRSEEARQAAAVFGATPVFLNFRETWIWHGRKRAYIGTEEFHRYNPPGRQVVSVASRLDEDVDLVVDLLQQFQPEITIIHAMGGEKHDHGNSGYLMYLAFRRAVAQGVALGKLWMRPRGWLVEPEARRLGRGVPDVRIDVTDYVRTKYEALNKHVSQNSGTRGLDLEPVERFHEEFITVIDNALNTERSEVGGPVKSRRLP